MRPASSSRVALAGVVIACALALLAGCRAEGGVNLLSGLAASQAEGVTRPELVTDGVAAREGNRWNSHRAAIFASLESVLLFDLGRSQTVRAAWLQADNNDEYELSISEDGKKYESVWKAPNSGQAGLRDRFSDKIEGRGRYLRLKPLRGDGNLAVTELAVYEQAPSAFPPPIPHRTSQPLDVMLRNRALLLGLALVTFVALAWRRLPKLWLLPISVLPVLAAVDFARALLDDWPAGAREVSFVRGTVAAVAAIVVVLEASLPERFKPRRIAVAGVLGICGVGALLAFYNLGHPQFYDQKLGAWTPVHHLDLRQYYATAKYFPEIGYFRIYEADLAAYSEDIGVSLEGLGDQSFRNLHTNRFTTVRERSAAIAEVKQHFSAERWQAYRNDARHFRETMGTSHWLETMVDLGGNATPVWIAIAHLMFNSFEASNRAFLITGLLDPLLLLVMFGAIGRCFGWRAMFVCMTVFGANDFIMFGTNWGGATLRHDWLAYLGLGACALRRERWLLAGVLFGMAASIRAFPGLALVGTLLPAAWWLAERVWNDRRLPSLRTMIAEQRHVLRVLIGGAAALVVLALFSSLVLSPQAWPSWVQKVSLLDADAHVNPVSLRTVIAGSDSDRSWMLTARLPLFIACALLLSGLLAVACRGKRPEQAAMFGLMLLPILLYPANYYLHLVCLLPLAAVLRSEDARPRDAADNWLWFLLLAMCAAQYFTVLISDQRLHFYFASFLLIATLTGALIAIARRDGPAIVRAFALRSSVPESQPGAVLPSRPDIAA